MRSLPKLTLLLLLLALPACGGEAEPPLEPATPTYQPGRPGAEDGHDATVMAVDPFTGESRVGVVRVQQLPSDAFFQEHYYPDSSVVDVKRIFGLPTVQLSTKDSVEKVDAFYRPKFTKPDGTVEGRAGNYYRMNDEQRLEQVKFQSAPGGGCLIFLQT